jgi:hypothetical protein
LKWAYNTPSNAQSINKIEIRDKYILIIVKSEKLSKDDTFIWSESKTIGFKNYSTFSSESEKAVIGYRNILTSLMMTMTMKTAATMMMTNKFSPTTQAHITAHNSYDMPVMHEQVP